MPIDQSIIIIQQVIDQAVKAGLLPNIDTAAAVFNAWNDIKKIVENGKSNNNNIS